MFMIFSHWSVSFLAVTSTCQKRKSRIFDIATWSPLVLRIASGSAIDSGTQWHLGIAEKWLACLVRAQDERRPSRNLCAATVNRAGTGVYLYAVSSGSRAIYDQKLLDGGCVRNRHGCQRDA